MPFNIIARGEVAAITQRRETAKEALVLAMTHINQGSFNVRLEDIETGEVLDADGIRKAAMLAKRQDDHA